MPVSFFWWEQGGDLLSFRVSEAALVSTMP